MASPSQTVNSLLLLRASTIRTLSLPKEVDAAAGGGCNREIQLPRKRAVAATICEKSLPFLEHLYTVGEGRAVVTLLRHAYGVRTKYACVRGSEDLCIQRTRERRSILIAIVLRSSFRIPRGDLCTQLASTVKQLLQ